ncbi:hypothetical protein [Okeania sp. SIO2C2]|uniref:hypothetical protein n=1 Tax=Okeania sp. SIO2C2 TaxID=2607787 RepID=UPI00257EDB02|nr:hypothetical protein [Okeania sp. SIO2C2]
MMNLRQKKAFATVLSLGGLPGASVADVGSHCCSLLYQLQQDLRKRRNYTPILGVDGR